MPEIEENMIKTSFRIIKVLNIKVRPEFDLYFTDFMGLAIDH